MICPSTTSFSCTTIFSAKVCRSSAVTSVMLVYVASCLILMRSCTAAETAAAPAKCRTPLRRIALWRGSLYDGTAEKPYFMRFSGIEKVHRNSIKITVDLWRSRRDLNPRYLFEVHTISSRARYDHFDTAPYSVVLHQTAHIYYYGIRDLSRAIFTFFVLF